MDNEREITLIDAGLKRVEAKTLLYLFDHNKTVSRSIEMETELRQPEVSSSISFFSSMGWISKKKGPKIKSRGRPETMFILIKKKADIIEHLKKQLKQKSLHISETLDRLDKLI